MKNIIILSTLFLTVLTFSQVKIGNNSTSIDNSSLLELESTNKGVLLPRIALTNVATAAPLAGHVKGMLIYNTAAAVTGVSGNAEGIYQNNGTSWVQISSASNSWLLNGNAGTSASTNFIGTKDDVDLVFRRNNFKAGFIGSGTYPSTAFGLSALNNLSTGRGNTALGSLALNQNSTGDYNIAMGFNSLGANTTGTGNTAIGTSALNFSNSSNNTVIGFNAMTSVNIGGQNVAVGVGSLGSSTGANNTAIGINSGSSLLSGDRNIFIGSNTSAPVTTGSNQLNIGNAIFGTGLSSASAAAPAGNIGIGVSAPTDKLHVAGSIRMVDGNEALGKVMVSDANGKGIWTTLNTNSVNTTATAAGTTTATVAGGNLEFLQNSAGMILLDSAGVKWKVTISTTGQLTIEKAL